ncbi:MAG: segregation/condensation protein A [Bacillota bacterium]|nr:segregation/condensation protein A [Bacillota bacterium]
MAYKVKLDVFEGPFDLLVYLIENAEMSVYDIRISQITNQYLDYVERLRQTDPGLGGEFMVLAATLIEIKSKMLLPRIQTEGGGAEEDPRKELVQKLLEYKRFKKAAALLEEREEAMRQVFTKPREDLSVYEKEPDYYLNLELGRFVKAFNDFLRKKKTLEDVHKHYDRVERQRMTVETRIEQLKSLFRRKKRLKFRELLEGETSRYNLVLTFLSLLELMKEKSVRVRQNAAFGEITLTVRDAGEKKGA